MPLNSDHDASVRSGPITLPVTIVGGYLGSGKTTLINHVLNHANGRKYAVLVNDFGELAIDAQLIESVEGDVINLSGGCVCCSYGNDLTRALMQLEITSIDQVVIEASGVALPDAIAGSLSLLSAFRVSAIVVLADSSSVARQLLDRYIADTIDRQLAAADLILINKTDLTGEKETSQIKNLLQQRYPSARLLKTSQAEYPLGLFLIDCSSNHLPQDMVTDFQVSHSTDLYNTFTLELTGSFDANDLATKLACIEPGLLRVKGFVRDRNNQLQLIQIVGKRWAVHKAPQGAIEGLVCIGLSSDKHTAHSVAMHVGLT